MKKEIKMFIISLYILEKKIQMLDELVRLGLYINRSDAIRFAIDDLIYLHKGALGL